MRSDSYHGKYRDKPLSRRLKSARYFEPGSNFSKLFTESRGPALLADWLGLGSSGFAAAKESLIIKSEFVGLTNTFRGKGLKGVRLIVMVPHPLFRTQADIGLIEDFAALKPPKLKIAYETEEIISGRKAHLYEKDGKGCTLLIRQPLQSVINLEVEDCADNALMIDLAESLTLDRFESKLNS